jgi:hypothetical protein
VVGVCLVGAIFVIVSSAESPEGGLRRAAEDWQTVFSETFESGIGHGWTALDVSDGDGGEYTWAANTFLYRSPNQSAWCVGGGLDGSDLVAGTDTYPDDVDSWLIYGPVDLGDVLNARLRFDWRLETGVPVGASRPWISLQTLEQVNATPTEGDWFGWCVLTGESDLDGARCTYVSGSTGSWASAVLPLDDYVPSETGIRDGIWIAFRFASDSDGVGGWGAFVDDVALEVRRPHEAFLPLVRRDPTPTATPTPSPTPTLTPSPTPDSTPVPADLENGGFEADWGDEESHRVLIFPTDGDPYETEIGNIFTPPYWLTWFYHDAGTWDQPEVTDMHADIYPERVRTGERGLRLFTVWRKHDAGFLQQIQVEGGNSVRLTGWAHAWSNNGGAPPPNDEEDGGWSEGAGFDCFFAEEGSEGLNSDLKNFTFWMGIDPTGQRDPYADTVAWGRGAHIYNCYHEVPSVEVEVENSMVTVFLRSRTLWPFKHNDAYWDDVKLEIIR